LSAYPRSPPNLLRHPDRSRSSGVGRDLARALCVACAHESLAWVLTLPAARRSSRAQLDRVLTRF